MKGKVEKNKKILKNFNRDCAKMQILKNKIKDINIGYIEKLGFITKLHTMRGSSITRYRNRCALTARVNGFKRITGLCGFQTKQAFREGLCPGFRKI